MAKKKQEEAPAGSPAWMATFSDLMNLLLCFFVLLFSMSSTDAAKFEMVVNSLKAAFSVMPSGGSTLTDNGALIGGGIAQLPGMSNYFGDSLDKGDKGDAASNVESEEESEETSSGGAASDAAEEAGGMSVEEMKEAGMTAEEIAAAQAAAAAAKAAAEAQSAAEAQAKAKAAAQAEAEAGDQAAAAAAAEAQSAAEAAAKAAADAKAKAEAGDQSGAAKAAENAQAAAATATAAAKAAAETQSAAEAAEKAQAGKDEEQVSDDKALEAVEKKALSQSEQMAEKIEKMTKQYGIQDLVEIDFNGQFVRVTLNGALLFESGSAELSEEALPLVEKMGKIIDIYQNNIVEVEGHTDNVPITSGRFESNDVLSMYRALSVANYLRENSNLPQENIVSSGRGAYVPVADNSTPEGRARNRRVEIKIYNELSSGDAAEG